MARGNKKGKGKQNGNTVHQQSAEKLPEPEAMLCKINKNNDIIGDEEQPLPGNIGIERILLLILDLIIINATAFRHRLQQRPPHQPWLRIWRQTKAVIKWTLQILLAVMKWTLQILLAVITWTLQILPAVIKWTLLILLAIFLARLAIMIFGIQDEVQTFEEFVKQKNKAYDSFMDTQSYYVDDLLGAQADLKENIEAMEKVSSNHSEHNTGEIAEIKHSIVEVKDEFQRFMVESQIHIVELQEKNNEMQEGIADMQQKMTSEMGGIRKEVDDARHKFAEIKHTLHSIEYSIKNLKDCWFSHRLFGQC